MFRFSIRELFLLAVIVALAVGWWLDSERKSAIVADYPVAKRLVRELRSVLSKEQHDLHRARQTIKQLEREVDMLELQGRRLP